MRFEKREFQFIHRLAGVFFRPNVDYEMAKEIHHGRTKLGTQYVIKRQGKSITVVVDKDNCCLNRLEDDVLLDGEIICAHDGELSILNNMGPSK